MERLEMSHRTRGSIFQGEELGVVQPLVTTIATATLTYSSAITANHLCCCGMMVEITTIG
jgi:hypothetical protein